jgi:O-antigen/teichoic acid export membrane protein
MKEKNFDERQVATKNRIGNQCFLLLTYLIFADVGLYGAGVRWLSYPLNIFVILLVCLFIYLVRLIASNSYVAPGTGNKKTYAVIAAIGAAIAVAAAVIVLLNGGGEPNAQTEDNGGTILFIISVVMLVIVLAVSLIRKRQDKDGRDE